MKILVLNAGSSSIKYQLFAMPQQRIIARGTIERIGENDSIVQHVSLMDDSEKKWQNQEVIIDHRQGLEKVSALLLDKEYGVIEHPNEVAVVGHRVVHGGEYFREAVAITDEVQRRIEQLNTLAPLHNPHNLAGIDVASEVFSQAQQVAVFDTAYHQTLPDYAFRYPVPNELYSKHQIRVYGMHGTSHRYIARATAAHLNKPLSKLNLISIHLGNGCSIAAIQEGRSIDTSMGLTPLAGLMMGTRSGDIDPAIPYYLQRTANMDLEAIDYLLNNDSGLKGITENNDVRVITQQYEEGDEMARLAIKMYCYRIKKYIGAYVAVLGSVDAIVFTAGVGENSALIRQKSCQGLDKLGIIVDGEKNAQFSSEARSIHASGSTADVLVIPTNEELSIAQQAYEVVQ